MLEDLRRETGIRFLITMGEFELVADEGVGEIDGV